MNDKDEMFIMSRAWDKEKIGVPDWIRAQELTDIGRALAGGAGHLLGPHVHLVNSVPLILGTSKKLPVPF